MILNANQKIIVFSETTLNADEVSCLAPGTQVLPSAKKGDVLRCLSCNPTAMIIIDGSFDQTPAVWHKEIMQALEQGVRVIGVSSMGALRAAELYPCGMIGFGEIYERYRSLAINDDEEVAVHFFYHHGEVFSTIALINLRITVENMQISEEEKCKLIDTLKSIHYKNRDWPTIAQLLGYEQTEQLKAHYIDVKKNDALACLKQLTKLLQQTQRHTLQVPQTFFMRSMQESVLYATETSYMVEQLATVSEFEGPIQAVKLSRARQLLHFLRMQGVKKNIKIILYTLHYCEQAGISLKPRAMVQKLKSWRVRENLLTGEQVKQWSATRCLSVQKLQRTLSDYFLLKLVLRSGMLQQQNSKKEIV